MVLGNLSQPERQQHLNSLNLAIEKSIETLFPNADKAQCIENINLGYNGNSRRFHSLQHVLQILPDDIQQEIVRVTNSRNNVINLTPDQMQKVISAAYHDINYHIDGHGSKDIIASFDASLEAVSFSMIKAFLTRKNNFKKFREEDVEAIQQLFGFEDNTRFTKGKFDSPYKLDGSPMNEFLSALTAIEDLAPNGIEELSDNERVSLLQTIMDIQMTVPFKKGHAENLFVNSVKVKGRFGLEVLSSEELLVMVNKSIEMSNLDIGNLWHSEFIHMFTGNWKIAEEFRPASMVNEKVKLRELYDSVTSTGFIDFVMKPANDDNRLVHPFLKLEKGGVVPVIDENYNKAKDAVVANIEASQMAAFAMGAAIYKLSLGAEPRLSWITKENAAANTIEGKRLMVVLELPDEKHVIPKFLRDKVKIMLKIYSLAELKSINLNAKQHYQREPELGSEKLESLEPQNRSFVERFGFPSMSGSYGFVAALRAFKCIGSVDSVIVPEGGEYIDEAKLLDNPINSKPAERPNSNHLGIVIPYDQRYSNKTEASFGK